MPQHNPERPEYDGENLGPFDHTKYAQCDFLLTKQKFSHTIKDCEVRTGSGKNTDPYPIYAEVRTNMKLAGESKNNKAGAAKILEVR